MGMQMLLHGLPPGMQDHREPDLPAEIRLPELLEELGSGVDEELEYLFPVEAYQRIEDVVDGEDDMKIMDGQQPFLLGLQPLGFLEGPALRTMAVLAGFAVE